MCIQVTTILHECVLQLCAIFSLLQTAGYLLFKVPVNLLILCGTIWIFTCFIVKQFTKLKKTWLVFGFQQGFIMYKLYWWLFFFSLLLLFDLSL